MAKQFYIKEFDRTKINLLDRVISYLVSISQNVEIEVWNETTGFAKTISLESLKEEFKKCSKQYTGLDEINIKINGQTLLSAIIHEDLCLLYIDEKTKKEIETKFKITILEFKNENH